MPAVQYVQMLRFLPPGSLEFLLFAVLVAAFVLVVRSTRRRHHVAAALQDTGEGDAGLLPSLDTQHRVTGKLRRIYFERGLDAWLAEITVGKRKLTFAVTDYPPHRERYRDLLDKEADVALYGLATLAPGGVEAMRDQIRDIDKVDVTPHLVRLVPAGQFPNDNVAIARILSHREDTLSDGTPLTVYRCEVIRNAENTLVMDLGVPLIPGAAPFADQEMVHGSARLFGYLSAA